MNRTSHWRAIWLLLALACPFETLAQSSASQLPTNQAVHPSAQPQAVQPNDVQADDPSSGDAVSLGDLARVVRTSKAPASPPIVIDNDNLAEIMDEVESHRLSLETQAAPKKIRSPEFALSSPDGTCSLSFTASNASPNPPFVSEDLPPAELGKLEGPATIEGDSLDVAMYNGSSWKLTEVTVGLTLVRRPPANEAIYFGSARLLPAAAAEPETDKKPSELTLLFHLKGAVPPLGSNVFHEKLAAPLAPDQEWHWTILGAKGIAAPAPDAPPQN